MKFVEVLKAIFVKHIVLKVLAIVLTAVTVIIINAV